MNTWMKFLAALLVTAGIYSSFVSTLWAKESKKATPVTLREDGVLLVEGKPFYPIGTYRDPRDTLTDFRGVLEAGFNVTHSYYFEEQKPFHNGGKVLNEDVIVTARRYLQEAQKNKLKVFMGLPRKMVKEGNLGAIAKYVNALKDEPALLVWYLLDEPKVQKVSPALMRKVKNTVTKADADHPAVVTFCQKMGSYSGSYDIAGFDPYPIRGHKGRVDEVLKFIRARKKEVKGKLTFWQVVQGHDLSKPKKGSPYRPVPAQIRCMAFLGIIAGARGTVFYWWPSQLCNILDFPGVWKEIGAINADLKKLSPILTAGSMPPAERKLITDGANAFPFLARYHGGNVWIVAANPTGKKASVSFKIPSQRVMDVLNSKRKLIIKDGRCELSLDPLEVSALKFSITKKSN